MRIIAKKVLANAIGSHHITRIIAHGTLGLVFILETLLIIYGLISDSVRIDRILVGGGVVLYVIVANWAAVKQRYSIASLMIMALYFAAASFCLLIWGINSPSGLLVLGFIIFLAGVLIGLRAIIPTSAASIVTIISIHIIHSLEIITPNRSALAMESHIGDIITYGSLFSIFALIAWIVSFHTATSFTQLQNAKKRLREQKATLARRLEEEAQKLREAQLAEIQQLYTFAQVGQSTTAILHELANQLNVLAFDINGLSDTHRSAKTINDAQESIRHINHTIHSVRSRIRSRNNIEAFNVVPLVKLAAHEIKKTGAACLFSTSTKRLLTKGDPTSLDHVISILINNARDASSTSSDGRIAIHIARRGKKIRITVSDNGPGLSKRVKEHLFKPQTSTKAGGMGVGLYIAKHIITTQFHGTLSYDNLDQKMTSFIITIPVFEEE